MRRGGGGDLLAQRNLQQKHPHMAVAGGAMRDLQNASGFSGMPYRICLTELADLVDVLHNRAIGADETDGSLDLALVAPYETLSFSGCL